jgi:broad specificity phosphatase PhoE
LDAPPAVVRDAGCNEYDHASLLHFFEGDQVQALRAAGDRRGYFLAIRHAMQAWSSHEGTVAGGETWREFGERVAAAFTRACDGLANDANVLVVTSGGAIGRYVATVLRAGPDAAIQLNLQTRNTGVTEVVCPPGKTPRLLAFNGVPHLEQPDRAGAVTFS